MEGDDHVRGLLGFVVPDIAAEKLQAAVAVLPGHLVAVVNDVLFQVQAGDVGLFAQNFRDVIVNNEGQIGFSAAEVNDAHRVPPVLCQKVIQKLQEPVDLLEFIVFGLDHPAVGGEHPQVHQGRHRHALGQQVLLLPVVGGGHGGCIGRRPALKEQLALFGHLQAKDRAPADGVQLAVVRHQGFQPVPGLFRGDIFVKSLGVRELFQLQHRSAAKLHGADGDLFICRPPGIAQGHADEGQGKNFRQPLAEGLRFAHASTSPMSVSSSKPVIFTGRTRLCRSSPRAFTRQYSGMWPVNQPSSCCSNKTS